MTAVAPTSLQHGSIVRLNADAGFGYVRDAAGRHCYIFVVPRAISHTQFRRLHIGWSVLFRVSDQARVDELIPT